MNLWFLPWIISIGLFVFFSGATANYEKLHRFNLMNGDGTYYSLLTCMWFSLVGFLLSTIGQENHIFKVLYHHKGQKPIEKEVK